MAEKKIKTREVVEKVKEAATQTPNAQSRRTWQSYFSIESE